MEEVSNIGVGRPHATPSMPTHTQGVNQGNAIGGYEKQDGHLPDGRVRARRSTDNDPQARNPIDPMSPNLPPP